MIDQFWQLLETWSDHILIVSGAITMILLNALFTYHAMRTADNRMHLMLKILHQNLKYFRSFDGRLNLMTSEYRKTGAHQNNEFINNNAQLTSISRQLLNIESMMNGADHKTTYAKNNARLLFPNLASSQLLGHHANHSPKISRPFENYKSNSAKFSKNKPQPAGQPSQPQTSEQSSIASLEKAARLMAIFRHRTNEDQIRAKKHG